MAIDTQRKHYDHTVRISDRLVPGITKKSSPCAKIQASASCDVATPFFFASSPMRSTISKFLGKFSFENLGCHTPHQFFPKAIAKSKLTNNLR